jgi:TonB family protein
VRRAVGAAVAVGAILSGRAAAAQQLPECWSFALPADPADSRVFPLVRLLPDGAVGLHDGSGTATWVARGDSAVVSSGASALRWDLTIRAGTGIPSATLRRGDDDPHGAEPSVELRANPLACASVDWTPAPRADVGARLDNIEDVDAAFRRGSPPELGTTRSALVRFHVDADGAVLEKAIEQTAGVAELDRAALEIARVARFEPAMVGGEPIESWVALWFHFR